MGGTGSGTTHRIYPKPYTTSATRTCQYCFNEFNAKGHARHEKACKVTTAAEKRDREYELRLEEESRLLKRGQIFGVGFILEAELSYSTIGRRVYFPCQQLRRGKYGKRY